MFGITGIIVENPQPAEEAKPMYMLCEDGSVIVKVGDIDAKCIGNVNDSTLWENIRLAPKLMKLCKEYNYPCPEVFLHKAERKNYTSNFELKSLKVAEGGPSFSISNDLLSMEYISALGIMPEGLMEEFNKLEAERKKSFPT
jgi:hypothetical protein